MSQQNPMDAQGVEHEVFGPTPLSESGSAKTVPLAVNAGEAHKWGCGPQIETASKPLSDSDGVCHINPGVGLDFALFNNDIKALRESACVFD